MGYSAINSKAELISYGGRCLGSASHEVEISVEQYDDAVNDTLQLFFEYAYSGSDEAFVELSINSSQFEYILDDSILCVMRVIKASSIGINKVFETEFYNKLANFQTSGGFLDYAITNSYINSIQDIIINPVNFTFNSSTKSLKILSSSNDDKILLHVVKMVSTIDTNYDYIWNHRFIKAMFISKLWRMWASNLGGKYLGTLFSGELSLNVDYMTSMADKTEEDAYAMLLEEFSGNIPLINR